MNADTFLIYLDRARYYALDAVSTISQCLCKPDATLKISGRTYKVERLLGEGGMSDKTFNIAESTPLNPTSRVFSFVYLVQVSPLYTLSRTLLPCANMLSKRSSSPQVQALAEEAEKKH